MSREVGYDVVEISKGEIVPLKGISDDDQKITIFDDYMVKKKKKSMNASCLCPSRLVHQGDLRSSQ